MKTPGSITLKVQLFFKDHSRKKWYRGLWCIEKRDNPTNRFWSIFIWRFLFNVTIYK